MKKNLLFIALAALILPVLARGLWFYRGVPSQRPHIATPDYASLEVPQAPLRAAESGAEDVEQMGGVVLFDMSHGNRFALPEVAAFTEAISLRGGRAETLVDPAFLEFNLKYARAFVVVSPSITFLPSEIRLVREFVERGGKLLVFTDATRNVIYYDFFSDSLTVYGDVNAANPLLDPFGITVKNDYLYNLERNEGNYRNVLFDQFGKSELTFGLKEVAFYGAHSVESPSGLILLQGTESTLSSMDDAHNPARGGAALSGDGSVIALGDFTFMSSPYNSYADNAVLIQNLADFALSGKQTPALKNFPFIFEEGSVQIYLTAEAQMTAEMVYALGRLQTTLELAGLKSEFVNEMPEDGNAIVISTFAPLDEVASFADNFGVSFNEGFEYITIEGLGDIGKYGNGVLLFEPGKNGNTLVMLSDGVDNLLSLLNTVSYGYLFDCITQDNIAVCGVGYGGSFSTEQPVEEPTDESTEEGEPAPEAEPTPSGG
jgi:hypothetical protein